MASELRVNTSSNRVGLGTITYTDTGPIISGITTGNNFKTGTTNVHSTGVELANINTGGSTATFGGYISLPQKIIHTGDPDTSIEFDDNTIKLETAGGERLRITSGGDIQLQGGTLYGDDSALPTFTIANTSGNSNNVKINLGENVGSDNGGIAFYTAGSSSSDLKMRIRGNNDFIDIIDDNRLRFHDGKLYIYHNGSNGYVVNGTGQLLHRSATHTFENAAGSTEYLRITSGGEVRIGGNEGGYQLSVIDESNRTTTAETALLLYAKHDGSGTTGAGFGTGIRFWGDRASGNVEQNMGRIMCTAEVNSGTTLSGALSFETSVAGGLAERLRITSGGNVNIGGNYTQTAYMAQIAGDLLLQKSQAAYQHPQIELYNSSNTAHGGSIKFSGHHNPSGGKFEEAVIKGFGGTGSGTGSLVIATGNGTDKFRLHSTGQLELKNGSFSHNVDCVMANSGTMEIGAGSIIKFRTATNNVLTIDANGHTIPGGYNGAKDLGSSSYRWRNVYTSDIDLCNESRGGNEVDGTWGAYTIQEGEDDLFLINRRSGKKYKFNLTEVS